MTFNLMVNCRTNDDFWHDETAYKVVAAVNIPGDNWTPEAWREAKQQFVASYPSLMQLFGSGRVAIVSNARR